MYITIQRHVGGDSSVGTEEQTGRGVPQIIRQELYNTLIHFIVLHLCQSPVLQVGFVLLSPSSCWNPKWQLQESFSKAGTTRLGPELVEQGRSWTGWKVL